MFLRHSQFTRLTILVVIALHGSAFACQYNVRDVGFVDLGGSSYVFKGIVDDGVEASFREAMATRARDAFLESNVRFEILEGDIPEAASRLPKPSAILMAPDGRTRAMALSTDLEALDLRLEKVLHSPLRDSLIDDLIAHYAVILVVNGPEEFDNELAQDAADGAVLHAKARMMMLPKEVKSPPIVRVLTQDEAKEEGLFLWSLGMEDPSDTQVVVLYGRGRVMGAPLRGLDIEEETLEIFLTIIGSDCECGLDRGWMQGPTFPAKWDMARTTQLTEALGFDPENPLIKAEMSSVLGKNAGSNSGPDSGLENLDEVLAGLATGYVEASVDFEAKAAESIVDPFNSSDNSESEVTKGSGLDESSVAAANTAPSPAVITFAALVAAGLIGGVLIAIVRRPKT